MLKQLKTFAFLAALSTLLIGFGFAVAGTQGLVAGLSLAMIANFISYWLSDRIVLAAHNAQELHPSESSGLYDIVDRLAQKAKLPTPRVYVIPDYSPNAFATGRNKYHAAIVVTQGLLSTLDRHELEGAIAHELSHIYARDTLLNCVTATMASGVLFFSRLARWTSIFGGPPAKPGKPRPLGAFEVLLLSIIAPFAALLIQLTISRSREYRADALAAKICGHPEWLANALRKIHNSSVGLPLASGGPGMAHLYIINPFSEGAILNLFSTHPPVEDRIRRLLAIRKQQHQNVSTLT